MDNVKFIEIVFENCELIVIPMSRVIGMDFGELVKYPNDKDTYRGKHLLLDVSYKSESELNYDYWDYNEPLSVYAGISTNNIENKPNVLGRIMNHNDIVAIDLLDDNEERLKYIYVPWHEDDEYSNRYMSVAASNGVLSVKIKKGDGLI